MSVDRSARKTAVGQVVGSRYELVSVLGEGGFGTVYRAKDRVRGGVVALKVLTKAGARHPASAARFQREAELARRLTHPNTVRILDFGVDDDVPFIAWELLAGRTLEAAIEAGPLSVEAVARMAVEMLGSLKEAHTLGVVHRDVKPANVFLTDDAPSRVKMLDFGVAKLLDPEGDPNPLTRKGEVPGTPSYMAPEQLSRGAITPAIDLYAVGLVMSEALTGKRVYDGDFALDVLRCLVADGPTPIPQAVLASPLGPIIERATRKVASERFADAAEMIAVLTAIPSPSPRFGSLDTMAPSHAIVGPRADPGAAGLARTSVVQGASASTSDIAMRDTALPDEALRDTELPPVSDDSPRLSADEVVARARSAIAHDMTARALPAVVPSDEPPADVSSSPTSLPSPTRSSAPFRTQAETSRFAAPAHQKNRVARVTLLAVVAAVVVATVIAVVAVMAVVSSGKHNDKPPSAAATAGVTEASLRPHVPVTLKELDNEAVMTAKLRGEGWSVRVTPASNEPDFGLTVYIIAKGSRTGIINMTRYGDEAMASAMEPSQRATANSAFKRAGNYTVLVSISDDAKAARDLLAAIAK